MSERTRIVIVGGVAGGASAAARARRLSEEAEIIMFERGEHISFANCGLPYHIGGEIADRRRLLVQTPSAMRKRFRIDVRTRTEVMRIDRDALEVVVRDLESGIETRVGYAPPYGSAKGPVNYAGFVASNVIRGDVKVCHVEDVLHPTDDQFLLDVRTSGEVGLGGIPGAVNIPVDELRERLQELPRDKEILITCQVGLRGYLAARILAQNGFACRNLSGGYKTFAASTEPVPDFEGVSKEMCDDTGSGSGAACDLAEADRTASGSGTHEDDGSAGNAGSA